MRMMASTGWQHWLSSGSIKKLVSTLSTQQGSSLSSLRRKQVTPPPLVVLSKAKPSPPPVENPQPPLCPPCSPHVVHQFAPSLLTVTENNSATFSSSNDPCVDFFFQIVPDTPPSKTLFLLQQAWQQEPLTALQLVFHLRGVRDMGKSDQASFYPCISWLHHHHPLTLLANVHLIPKFGYYKDLLEMVQREIEGAEETEKRLHERVKHNKKMKARKSGVRFYMGADSDDDDDDEGKREIHGGYWSRKGRAAREAAKNGTLQDRETRIAASLVRDKAAKEAASLLRKEKRAALALRAQKKIAQSPNLAALCDAVVEIFALQLIGDKKALDGKKLFDISLAAKWCPSYQKSYDLCTGLTSRIACRLFSNMELPLLDEEKYTIAITDKLRKEYLVPLRQALQIPEVYMSANKWDMLPYERVPSVAMTRYAPLFQKHDMERYTEFLQQVKEGKKKVSAGALLPHNIVHIAVMQRGEAEGDLAEAQWKRMVSDLKESGSRLSSSLAVCDVSASMNGRPLDVCIALGLLVSELSEEPWKNHICTFSDQPAIHLVRGETLADRYRFTNDMNWDMNTNFQSVFRLLLRRAQDSKLPREKMIKRLFVFSDMEFDRASANPWETDYMMITKMYAEAGYGEPPEIVFWNLRDTWSTPVLASQKGVALVSGFSKNLLKVFLKGEDEPLEVPESDRKPIEPKEVMMKALSGELFQELKVVD